MLWLVRVWLVGLCFGIGFVVWVGVWVCLCGGVALLLALVGAFGLGLVVVVLVLRLMNLFCFSVCVVLRVLCYIARFLSLWILVGYY